MRSFSAHGERLMYDYKHDLWPITEPKSFRMKYDEFSTHKSDYKVYTTY
jgi:hypothetical protein